MLNLEKPTCPCGSDFVEMVAKTKPSQQEETKAEGTNDYNRHVYRPGENVEDMRVPRP